LNCYNINSAFFATSHCWEATTALETNAEGPILYAAKRSPVTLVSGNIRRLWIFDEVPLDGGPITVRFSTTAIFGDLPGYSSETLEIRPAILHGDMLPLVGL